MDMYIRRFLASATGCFVATLASWMLIASCSSTYNYYFDHLPLSKRSKALTRDCVASPDTLLLSDTTAYAQEILMASTSSELVVLSGASKKLPNVDYPRHRSLIRRGQGIALSPKEEKRAAHSTSDRWKKNWTASVGFLSVVCGILWAAALSAPALLILVPAGIVLCVIGLGSDLRGWAIAGLAIGTVAMIIIITAYIQYVQDNL